MRIIEKGLLVLCGHLAGNIYINNDKIRASPKSSQTLQMELEFMDVNQKQKVFISGYAYLH